MMFTISVETHFRASHQLTLPDGSKEPLHQHNWIVTAKVGSKTLDRMGLVMDFSRLKAMVDKTIADFDNAQFDCINYFRRNNPSAENTARYIFGKLEPQLPVGVKLQSVKVIEEPGCSAEFGK